MKQNSYKLRNAIFGTAGLCAFLIAVFSIFSDIAEEKRAAASSESTSKAPAESKAAAIPITAPASSPAEAQDDPQDLALETVKLISLQKDMIITAVRQKHSRGGEEDFQKFLQGPIDGLSKRWGHLPFEVRNRFIYCITALSSHEWHMRDSFKAEEVLPPTSLIAESVEQCEKDSRPANTNK